MSLLSTVSVTTFRVVAIKRPRADLVALAMKTLATLPLVLLVALAAADGDLLGPLIDDPLTPEGAAVIMRDLRRTIEEVTTSMTKQFS